MNHDKTCLKSFWYHFDGRNTRAKILFETTATIVFIWFHLYSIHPSLARHLALRIPSFHNFTHLEPAELRIHVWKNNMACFHANSNLFGMFLDSYFSNPSFKGTYCIFSHFEKKSRWTLHRGFSGWFDLVFGNYICLTKGTFQMTWICGLRDPAPLNRSTRTQKPWNP